MVATTALKEEIAAKYGIEFSLYRPGVAEIMWAWRPNIVGNNTELGNQVFSRCLCGVSQYGTNARPW